MLHTRIPKLFYTLKILAILSIPSYGLSLWSTAASEWPQNIDSLLRLPKVRAFLDMIAYAEGTYVDTGYRMFYGGTLFNNFNEHPRLIHCYIYGKNPLCSSAAGRYQILYRSWDRVRQALQLKDFRPINQDKAALGLIQEMEVLDDLVAGNLKKTIKILAAVWASFPESPYNQKTHSFEVLEKFYKERLAHYTKSYSVRRRR